MSDSSSSEDEGIEYEIYTPDEILVKGLCFVGYNERKLRRKNLSRDTKEERMVSHYGANSVVCAALYEDLQKAPNTSKLGQLQKKDSDDNIKDFFMALYFLKLYECENPRASRFGVCVRYARDHSWDMIKRIRGLLSYKIFWPEDNFGDDIWAISVDGTHMRSQEKRSNELELNLDPRIFSYKHRCAGFNYEVGLSLSESKCVWLNGPYEAGTFNDIKIFSMKGLRKKLLRTRKKCIADGGYRGFPNLISTPNNRCDLPEVRKFKSRARLRHERYNAMLKSFACIGDGTFHHGKEKLQWCVESVAVIVQYKMEYGEPLYDI